MKKFRRWLIHKLGGICKDDIVRPIISEEKERELQRIKSEFVTTFEDVSEKEVKKYY